MTLNQQNRGDIFVIFRDDGDFMVRTTDLEEAGLQKLPGERVDIDGEPFISLNSLAGVEYHFNQDTLTLELTSAPEFLPKNTVDLTPARKQDVIYPRDNSIFFNYGVDYTAGGDDFAFEGLTVGNELGVRRRDLLLLTDTLYSESTNDTRFVRLNTSLTYDDRQTLRRFIGGDIFASSGDLGSRVQLGGLSVSKLYRIDPYFIRYPLFDMSGMASLPSDVELYVDGVKVRSQRFAPGEFELRNFQGFSGGAQTIEIVIRDALGREQRIVSPYYFTDQILRRGLHEYSYNLGWLRRDFGQESNDYADLAASAFHRYGWTDALNLGLRGEAGNGLFNLGIEAAMKTGSIGLLRLEGAGSQEDEGSGAAGFLSYEYSNRQFRGRLALQGFSRDYRTLGSTDTTVQRKLNLLAGVGYTTPQLGSFGIDYSRTENFQEAERETLSFSWSRRLWQRTYVNTSLRQIRQSSSTAYEAAINLTRSFGRDYSISGAVQRDQNQDIQSIEARRTIPSGVGTGWNLRGERTELEGGEESYLLNSVVQHNAKAAIMRGDFSQNRSDTINNENHRLSLAGALVQVGDTYAVTRPVRDSFALVSVGAADNVRVYVNGQTSGHTDRRGKVVIPDLSSYYENQLSIEDKDIPLDFLMPRVRLNISPPLRSGSCINFPLQKYQAVTGTLSMAGGEEPVPLAYAELDLVTPAGLLTFWTGGDGEFYLDSQQVEFDLAAHQGCAALEKKEAGFLPAGVYPLTIKLEGRTIQTNMTIPPMAEQYTELGEIVLPIPLPTAAAAVTPLEPVSAEPEVDHSVSAPAAQEPEANWPAITTIHFPFNRTTPIATELPLLSTVTNVLLTRPEFTVKIEGYTCHLGNKNYNDRLGQRRAEAIRKYLLTQGVAARKISQVTSYGLQYPACTETDEDCLRQNRRVVLRLGKDAK